MKSKLYQKWIIKHTILVNSKNSGGKMPPADNTFQLVNIYRPTMMTKKYRNTPHNAMINKLPQGARFWQVIQK